MAKPPSRRSSSTEIAQFLAKSKAVTEFVDAKPRLMFAIDATASRQPTWDRACHLQREMFSATEHIAQLSVQLCYYRGFHEFFASRWLGDSAALARLMSSVYCEGGHTQIARLLKHALAEHRKRDIRALVFIGDALEESADTLCDLAGQCGMLKLPLFLFQEGHDGQVEQTFRSMARLSGGAWARFDSHSAQTLAGLLGAVASYAAGGRTALENSTTEGAKLLLQQLKD
ncbi:MAG: VWA domain-containing protein [Halioglobus sp.]|nr:VWA domain-containing protein [Halioglobus sp.]